MAYAESRTANQKPENLKFSTLFNKTLIGRNLVGISKKREKEQIKQEKCAHWIFRLRHRD